VNIYIWSKLHFLKSVEVLIGLHADILFGAHVEAGRHLRLKLISRGGDQADVHVAPVRFQIRIHSGKRALHRINLGTEEAVSF
jgi:hypothetical protein